MGRDGMTRRGVPIGAILLEYSFSVPVQHNASMCIMSCPSSTLSFSSRYALKDRRLSESYKSISDSGILTQNGTACTALSNGASN